MYIWAVKIIGSIFSDSGSSIIFINGDDFKTYRPPPVIVNEWIMKEAKNKYKINIKVIIKNRQLK